MSCATFELAPTGSIRMTWCAFRNIRSGPCSAITKKDADPYQKRAFESPKLRWINLHRHTSRGLLANSLPKNDNAVRIAHESNFHTSQYSSHSFLGFRRYWFFCPGKPYPPHATDQPRRSRQSSSVSEGRKTFDDTSWLPRALLASPHSRLGVHRPRFQ